MPGLVEVQGLAELRREMRAAVDASPAELSRAMRAGSTMLRDRMVALAPKKTGALVGSFRVFSRARTAGVRSDLPYAGVQEFAKKYTARNRGGQGTHTVTMRNVGAPPRFGYKALDEMGEQLAQVAADALVKVLACHGWLQ